MLTGYFTWSLSSQYFATISVSSSSKEYVAIYTISDEAGEWGTIADNMTGDGVLGAVVERRADIGISALYSW